MAAMVERWLRYGALILVAALPAEAAGNLEAAGRIYDPVTGGSCSGVLVAPGMVATAAHCIPGRTVEDGFDGITFRTAPPSKAVAVEAGFLHPLYDSENARTDWKFRFDIGLLRLADRGYGGAFGLMPVGEDAEPGETLFLVSWRLSDGPQPRQRPCPVLSIGIEGLVTLGCEVTGGESGAPLFRKRAEGGLELVAILSSRGQLLDQPIAQASNLRLRLPPLLDMARAANP